MRPRISNPLRKCLVLPAAGILLLAPGCDNAKAPSTSQSSPANDTQAQTNESRPTERSIQANPANSSKRADASAIQITDDTGQQVTFNRPPQAIATTAGFAVEYLMALDHPPVLRPDVEGPRVTQGAQGIDTLAVDHSVGPNMEQLAQAQPELVITTPTFASFADGIKRSTGAKVLVLEINDLAGVWAKARVFGRLLGKPKAGERLAKDIQKRINAIKPAPRVVEAGQGPTVFAMFGTPASFFAVRSESYLGSLIEHLGGQLVTEGERASAMSGQFAPFSLEKLVAENPDVILLVHHGSPGQGLQGVKSKPAWKSLRAVQNNRVYRLSQWLFVMNPGPSAVDALERLRNVLYPEQQPE